MSDLYELWIDMPWSIRLLAISPFVLLLVLIPAVIAEQREWTAFKAEHNCRIVGQMSGSVSITTMPIIGGSGGVAFGVSSTPDKTGWLCDDGITYWR